MLKADDTALVIVDVQGKLADLMHGRDQLFRNLVIMAEGAKVLDIPILWNEQLPDKLGETVSPLRSVLDGLKPLVKKTFSCCGNDSFVAELNRLNRRQVLLVGIESHVCVYQTACDLLRAGHEVHLVTDAVSSRTPENKQIGIEATRASGAHLTSTEMALFEMLQVAEGDRFRRISKLVK
jgi:nicotinamidase-related amidase